MNATAPFVALIEASIRCEQAGEMGAALAQATAALAQAQANQDTEQISSALTRMAEIHYRMGHLTETRELAEQALASAGADTRPRADALNFLGVCEFEADAFNQAEAIFLEAADLGRRIAYPQARFRSLHNLAAGVYALRGQFDLALAAYDEAYRIAGEYQMAQQPVTMIAAAFIYIQTGKVEQAHAALALISAAALETAIYRGYVWCMRGFLALAEGDNDSACERFAQSSAIAEQLGDPALNIFNQIGRCRLQLLNGNPAAALEWAGDAVNWAERACRQRMWGRTLIERGRAAWANGDPKSAEGDLRSAIAELGSHERFFDLARAQFYLAALLHKQGHPQAEAAWQKAAGQILAHGYEFLLDEERRLAYPLISAHLNSANVELAGLSARCVERLQRLPPAPLRVQTLGRFEVFRGWQVIPAPAWRRHAGELFRMLLISPKQTLSREQVIEALWPEKSPETASAVFHQATSALRRALEPDLPDKFPSRYLFVEEGQAALRLPAGSQVDFEQFEACVQRQEWQAALNFYEGELFPADHFREWAAWKREHLSRLYVRALLVVAGEKLAGGEPQGALDACERILAADPWHEQAVLLGMQACIRLNDRTEALRLYLGLERRLQADLGVSPQDELRELYRALLR